MSYIEYTIQNLVFPKDEKLTMHPALFYRGERSFLNAEKQELYMGKYINIDFTTYFNGCSYKKWMEYTSAEKIKIQIEAEGSFKIDFVGYHLELYEVVRKVFHSEIIHAEKGTTIEFEYPANDETIVGFDISSIDYCKLLGGRYVAIVDSNEIRNVNLNIVTTTCKKEKFILKNIDIFKNEILNTDVYENASQIYVTVVDNGRTLDAEKISEKNLKVYPNKNVGGSGGFARGMLEAINSNKNITHVLLMDDDVLIMSESIKRTYALLTLAKEKYANHFISGAMMLYEEANVQHEDIGTLRDDCFFIPFKPRFRHEHLFDNIKNEGEFTKWSRMYAAWWYCCIPMTVIKRNGLPMPFFVRVDDCEYSLRCNAEFMSMNGICIWHLGFGGKFNTAMEHYQQLRNWFILKATNDRAVAVDVYTRWKEEFKKEILRYNYGSAEHVVKAMEDYLKGPEFIEKDMGEKILIDNTKLNEKLTPLEKFTKVHVDLGLVYQDNPRKKIDKLIYHLTYNGHRWWPRVLLKKEIMPVPYDWGVVTQKQTLRKELIAVNPHTREGCIRKQDREKYKELHRRYVVAERKYRSDHEKIDAEYRKHKTHMTSEAFWRQYLEIQ